MTLAAGRLKTKPEHAFFRDFDKATVLIPRVRNDDKVRLPEGIGFIGEKVTKAFSTGGLFIGDKGKSDGIFWNNTFIKNGSGRKEGGNEVLLVILHAPAEQSSFADVTAIRVFMP